ncbi:HPr family phosphocarrier protein [Gilvimarinus xylanilyticus]|uniref:HPr family phosphocarrier protein n=1 Tax=Gilvimarinus xylanilyticus TaxID=2944139 RepID=A0A9X2KUS3_9GAMM|nr:HPr family phosphocarrier protein [Gilvimarinus xylanilyticus]MCP8900193.1 HPr family phosphocarrier protein [Gilvimarinus xylanilyticus]
MAQRTVTIVNKKGLHARSAAKLVSLGKELPCAVEVHFCDKRADCTSMMALMMLAAGLGSQLSLTAEGEHADHALERVCHLIESGFDELGEE